MSFKFIASIRLLSLVDIDLIETPFFKISDHATLKEEHIDDAFRNLVGPRINNSLEKNQICFSFYEDDNDDEAFQNKMSSEFYQRVPQIETFLLFLWFVKDNSVSLEEVYGQFTEAKKYTYWNGHKIFSTCNGKFKKTEFNKNEIDFAIEILLNYTKNCISETSDCELNNSSLESKELTEFRSSIDPFKEENRIERALTFLSTARASAHIPQKITHYMTILECLFSTQIHSIVFNVSRRVSAYLNDESVKRKIKTAYDIRSRFVHGEKMKWSHEFISEIALQVDEIIRQVLRKVIMLNHKNFLSTDMRPFLNSLHCKK